MKQQQFEDLLFTGTRLSAKQQKEWDAFLSRNSDAARLAKGWPKVSIHLDAPQVHTPQAGFSQRWLQLELADRQKKEQTHAFWSLTVSAVAIAGLIYLAWANNADLVPSVIDSILTSFRQALELASFAQILSRVFISLVTKMPLAWWSSIAASLVLFPALWLTVYQEFAIAKGVRK